MSMSTRCNCSSRVPTASKTTQCRCPNSRRVCFSCHFSFSFTELLHHVMLLLSSSLYRFASLGTLPHFAMLVSTGASLTIFNTSCYSCPFVSPQCLSSSHFSHIAHCHRCISWSSASLRHVGFTELLFHKRFVTVLLYFSSQSLSRSHYRSL